MRCWLQGCPVSLADKLVQSGELSIASGAKFSGMPYARYLQHLGTMGYSLLDARKMLNLLMTCVISCGSY